MTLINFVITSCNVLDHSLHLIMNKMLSKSQRKAIECPSRAAGQASGIGACLCNKPLETIFQSRDFNVFSMLPSPLQRGGKNKGFVRYKLFVYYSSNMAYFVNLDDVSFL